MKYLIVCLLVLSAIFSQAQRHETGVAAGGFYANTLGKTDHTWYGGWSGGIYYKYTPLKWVGIQSGLYYQNVSRRLSLSSNLKHSLVLPIRLILFSDFRFNFLGGIYMENLMGNFRSSDHYDEGIKDFQYINFDKKPIFGYEIGGKWNMKYFNLVIAYRRDFTSWMNDVNRIHIYTAIKEAPKASAIHATLEIPIWRSKHSK